MTDNDLDELTQRITISVDIAYTHGTEILAATVLLDVLAHLENDGIRPLRTTLEITDPPTT
jgi:hypothetical protein